MTYGQTLKTGIKKLTTKEISSARLDAEVLLAFVLNISREQLLAHSEKALSATQANKFQKLITRRAKYEPVAYLIGSKEFYGLRFIVNNNVLIPRPETEQLVEIVNEIYQNHSEIKTIIDVGTGSGVIALTLRKGLPKAQILALEASPKALTLARLNAKKLDLRVDFLKSDLLARVPVKSLGGSILAVNLPYVAKSEVKKFTKEIRLGLRYEPADAIFAGQDGTAVYRQLFQQVAKLPIKPAYLLAEIGSHYYRKFLSLAKQYFPTAKIELKKDLAGRQRFLIIKF
jgi:release factor glutamine methyltransferase